MAHDYQSFLLRCWLLGDGSQRIAIEHVQSGERALVATLDAARAWLHDCLDAPPTSPPDMADGAGPAADPPPSRPLRAG